MLNGGMRLLLGVVLGVVLRVVVRARRLPANRPAAFRGQGAVVCVGAGGPTWW
jgi:hypothetical protein